MRVRPELKEMKTVVKPDPLKTPVKDFLHNILRMHTGQFMDLCLDDLADDQERLQRYCDMIALATGLRLSFTYGSVQYSNSAFLVVETNAPGAGFFLIIFSTLASCFDLIAVLVAVLISTSITMVNSEEQLLYLAISCRRTLRIPFQFFFIASYTFAAAFLTESYVRTLGLDTKQPGVSYEAYDDEGVLSSLAFKGYIAGAIAWMLPMPIVHIPISLLLTRLYQSRDLVCSYDKPSDSKLPQWFADPEPAELSALLDEYMDAWGPTGTAGRFRNATPDHWMMFVLRKMKAKGHGSLSYIATKRIEAMFEERVEELIEGDKVKNKDE